MRRSISAWLALALVATLTVPRSAPVSSMDEPNEAAAAPAGADDARNGESDKQANSRPRPNLLPPPTRPTLVGEPTGGDAQPIVDALLEVRRANGSLLQGTIFDDESQSESAFADALKQVIEESPLQPSGPIDPFASDLTTRPAAHDAVNAIDRQVVELVQTAATLLDEKAAQLEKQRRYRESDQAHRTARRFRHLVRDIRDRLDDD